MDNMKVSKCLFEDASCRCFTGCLPRDIPEVVSLGEETPRSGTRRCKEQKILDRFGPRGA
jgi:hypothetical protein